MIGVGLMKVGLMMMMMNRVVDEWIRVDWRVDVGCCYGVDWMSYGMIRVG